MKNEEMGWSMLAVFKYQEDYVDKMKEQDFKIQVYLGHPSA